jgi:peptidoglycan/xylan/chitin deacetylase (PgdA/CDA1 family)
MPTLFSIRKQAQRVALKTLHATGVLNAIAASPWRRNRLLVLCYHGISLRDEHIWSDLFYITPEHFRAHMEILRRTRANVLELDDALSRLRAGALPDRSVVITFDDGFYDFYHYAVPVLREFEFPSTVYLTTHYCKYLVPIFNLMTDYMLWKKRGIEVDGRSIGLPGVLDLRTDQARRGAHASLLKFAEVGQMTTVEKDVFARRIAGLLEMDYDGFVRDRMLQIMRPEEIQEILRYGVDIQLHTHRHRTPNQRDLFIREIVDNRARILEVTGKEPRHFCYPSGVYKPAFFPWLEDAGVYSATTCEQGLATAGDYLLQLPRLLADSRLSGEELRAWVCGLPN